MSDARVVYVVVFFALANLVVLFLLYRFLSRQSLHAALLGMVLFATLGTEYCLRPIRILSSGEFGWEPSVARSLTTFDADGLATTSILSFAGIAAFALAFRLAARPGGWRGRSPSMALPQVPPLASMKVPLGLVTVAGVIVSGYVALQLGSLGGSLRGEFGRQNIGSGYAYLLVDLAGLSVLVAIATLPRTVLLRWQTRVLLASSYTAFIGIHFLVLGGRAEIIMITIAALMITTARLGRPKRATLIIGLALAPLLLGAHRVATREAFSAENRDASPLSLALASLRDPLELVTRYDVSAYDKLVLMEQAHGDLGHGETYVAVLLAPLPGSDTSRLEGGNRVFTRRFIPARYRAGVTFEGISMFGEARYNLGRIGPPLVGVLTGFTYGTMFRRTTSSRKALLLLALAAGVFPSLIRADLLNTAALGGSIIVFAFLISAVVTRHQSRRTPVVGPLTLPGGAGTDGGRWSVALRSPNT